jgi:nicotinate-nucleotide pyrophosphorylase (carboxylating)
MTASIYQREFKEYDDRIKERALDAFEDDLDSGDITTNAVFEGHPEAKGVIIAEEDCTLAGTFEARAIFEDGKLKVSGRDDGEDVNKGDIILTIEGSLREILMRERTALNYITRMSGIATFSRRLFRKYSNRVLFLRKTDPGLLFSEKRAVALGGCLPHRINLSDGILIKDNHLDELGKESDKIDAIRTAILRANAYRSKKFLPIEIEVEDLEQAKAAAEEFSKIQGPNIILLDNMSPEDVKKTSKIIKSIESNIVIEASGGIKEDTIGKYLDSGADYVSSSMFVSAKPCNFQLELSR